MHILNSKVKTLHDLTWTVTGSLVQWQDAVGGRNPFINHSTQHMVDNYLCDSHGMVSCWQ